MISFHFLHIFLWYFWYLCKYISDIFYRTIIRLTQGEIDDRILNAVISFSCIGRVCSELHRMLSTSCLFRTTNDLPEFNKFSHIWWYHIDIDSIFDSTMHFGLYLTYVRFVKRYTVCSLFNFETLMFPLFLLFFLNERQLSISVPLTNGNIKFFHKCVQDISRFQLFHNNNKFIKGIFSVMCFFVSIKFHPRMSRWIGFKLSFVQMNKIRRCHSLTFYKYFCSQIGDVTNAAQKFISNLFHSVLATVQLSIEFRYECTNFRIYYLWY